MQSAKTLNPEQIQYLAQQLKKTRHNINGCVGAMILAAELIQIKPETAEKHVKIILDQKDKIGKEQDAFRQTFEDMLGIPSIGAPKAAPANPA